VINDVSQPPTSCNAFLECKQKAGTLVLSVPEKFSNCPLPLAKGDARLVLVAANCPEAFLSDIVDSHPGVPVHRVQMVNRQLGAACARPFSISALCIIDPGQSELMSLQHNI